MAFFNRRGQNDTNSSHEGDREALVSQGIPNPFKNNPIGRFNQTLGSF